MFFIIFFAVFFMLSTWYCRRCLLNLLEDKRFSHPPQLLIVYDSLWSSKMFHHFFRTFFTCYSTRCLLKFLLVITISRIHCNFGFISMVYACYSTRCLLNLLEDKRFLHSMHVIAQDVCWISFSSSPFLAFTATSGVSQWFMHVTAQDVCWIYSRINVSCILCML